MSKDWFDWPALPDLFPTSFPGVKTSRDGFLVDTDPDRLKARVGAYFDENLSPEDIAGRYPSVTKTTARFDARSVRDLLLRRGGPDESGFIRFAYRPFDNRWLYWEKDTSCSTRSVPTTDRMCSRGILWVGSSKRGSGRFFAWHVDSESRELEIWFLGCASFPHMATRRCLWIQY